jgi:hypothetical protein
VIVSIENEWLASHAKRERVNCFAPLYATSNFVAADNSCLFASLILIVASRLAQSLETPQRKNKCNNQANFHHWTTFTQFPAASHGKQGKQGGNCGHFQSACQILVLSSL